MSSDNEKVLKLIDVWKSNPQKFIEDCIKIVDKKGQTVPFRLNNAQIKILDELRSTRRLCILKARQLGSTTFVAAYFLHRVLFEVNFNCAIVAHTGRAASQIFNIAGGMFERLPPIFKKFSLWQTTTDNKSELCLKNGSALRVGTASSQFWRGSTYQACHLSEFAFWQNIPTSMASIMQAAADDAQVVIESTADGWNEFKEVWDEALDGVNGYVPLFLSWQDHLEYRLSSIVGKDGSAEEIKFGADVGMCEESFNWYLKTKREKCLNSQKTFDTEYPSDPSLAFAVTGDRYFDKLYPVDVKKITSTPLSVSREPILNHSYVFGCDVAGGGQNGDASVVQIIDATIETEMEHDVQFVVRKEPRFFARDIENLVRKWAKLAHHIVVVIESNNHGVAVIDFFRNVHLPPNVSIYMRKTFDTMYEEWKEAWGFQTNTKTRPLMLGKLKDFVESGFLKETTHMRTRSEMNSFVHTERGKIEGQRGSHDDCVMSLGLCIMGLDQLKRNKIEAKVEQEPVGMRQILQWELDNGRLYNNGEYDTDTDIADYISGLGDFDY